MIGLDHEQFRNRWDLDLINHLVVALNEGRPIEPVLKKAFGERCIRTQEGKLDLRGIELSHQNLRGPWIDRNQQRIRAGVDLHGVDLSGAALQWILLPRADLRDSILRDADLRDAELIHCDMTDADLRGADLTGAWLFDTRLTGAAVNLEQLAARRSIGQLDLDYHAYEK